MRRWPRDVTHLPYDASTAPPSSGPRPYGVSRVPPPPSDPIGKRGQDVTQREEFTAPTCPVCGDREKVQREKGRWLCGGCWTLFTGGQDEWERSRAQRERRASAYQWIRDRADAKEAAS